MRKFIYLLTTTPSSHTHRFHPLPLVTPTSCSPHPLATPIHSTHSPLLSSILLTCAKFKVWMTIVESGWNVWVWLVGVVVRRYIDFLILFPYFSCICSYSSITNSKLVSSSTFLNMWTLTPFIAFSYLSLPPSSSSSFQSSSSLFSSSIIPIIVISVIIIVFLGLSFYPVLPLFTPS